MASSLLPANGVVEAQIDSVPGVGVVIAAIDGERSDVRSYGARFDGKS
ncbi:MAG: hypothetical protein IAI50_14390, partial [Candidatus Eremiobacteraeota bacterium]|nr:hypothetical protein [Candidatus Eremiobacteraeota bacterium]